MGMSDRQGQLKIIFTLMTLAFMVVVGSENLRERNIDSIK